MKRVYLDANIVIYFVEQPPRFFPVLLQHMFDHNGTEQVTCVTSDLVRLETRVLPLREGDPSLLNRYDAFFSTMHTHAVPMGREVFDLATQLRAEHRLKTPDALHLAAALHSGCDEFWTLNDHINRAAQQRLTVINLADSAQ